MAGFFDKFTEVFGGGTSTASSIAKKPHLAGVVHTMGIDRKELAGFMQQAGTLASAKKRVDPGKVAPTFGQKTESVTMAKARDIRLGLDQLSTTTEFSQDQLKGFISSFRQRQEEVFGRRARPGISQTRLV